MAVSAEKEKKFYDIRNIDELHRLRADLYEERKHLSADELIKATYEAGREFREKVEAARRESAKAL